MNIKIGKKQHLTTYRKIAIASWRHPRNPNTYSMLDLPVEPAMEFLKANSDEVKLTLTHFVTKIVAHCLGKYSELNHVLRMGCLYARQSEDIFVTTLLKTPKGKDLSGFVIRDVNDKTIDQVAEVSQEKAEALRKNTDKENLKVQQIVNPVPAWILKPLLLMQEFFQFTLNWAIPWLGMPEDRFGSAMITNIGALGIENAFIPLSPYSRCPLLVGVGKVRKVPMVKDNEVVVGDSVMISLTFDHRYADGAHGAHLMRRFQKIFTNPENFKEIFTGK